MTIPIIILLLVAGIVALLLIIALFIKREHFINREIIINAPRQQVFDFLKLLKNQQKFNKWTTAGINNMEENFTGTDGTVGFIYALNINNSTVINEKQIISIIDGKRIETEVRLIKPFRSTSNVIYETVTLSENQTRVNLINTEKVKYPLNLLIPIAQKRFPKRMDETLSTLKSILEK